MRSGERPTVDREAPTLLPCPKCAGARLIVEETATGHRGRACEVCDATGLVTSSQWVAYERAKSR